MGTLYVIGTPIGNLTDLSDRARETLSRVDLILCEDTRVTGKLLSAISSTAPRESFHQHTTDAKRAQLIARLAQQDIALVSDAGTPGISDPGGKLVADAVAAGATVTPIPGPNAAVTLLSVSGFPTDTFTFLGFPPHKKGRQAYFDRIANTEHVVVFYESKHRVEKALAQLPQDRPIVVGRELTKLHETIYRGTPKDVLEAIRATSAKGEFTIVVSPHMSLRGTT